MEPRTQQHIWFWIAATCLVGSVMSLRTAPYAVVENAVETAPIRYEGPVYRSRAALPVPQPKELFISANDVAVQHNSSTPSNSLVAPPLLPKQNVEKQMDNAIENSPIIATRFEETEAVPEPSSIPESIWLSGGIELTE